MDGASVAQLAASVGLQGQNLQIAVAIANAESGFNERAVSSTGDYGLWQINLEAHPQYSAEQMFNPSANAAAMWEISGGGGNWNPWTTYTGGNYLAYMGDAASYVSGVGAGGMVDPADQSTADQLSKVLGFANAQLGKPYEWGATGPDTYDCSGLIWAAYNSAGISIGRDVGAQALEGHQVPNDQTRPGDVIIMDAEEHDGMAISSTQLIEAPHTGDVVKIIDIPWDRVEQVRRIISGGSSSFWDKIKGGIGDFLGGVKSGIDPLGTLKEALSIFTKFWGVTERFSNWVSNRHNFFRILQAMGGLLVIVAGISMTSKGMGLNLGVANKAKTAAGALALA